MSQALLVSKDREVARLRTEVQSLSNELNRALQALSDREAESARLSEALVQLRDQGIQRDLQLTSVRLHAGSENAEAGARNAMQANTLLCAERDRDDLRRQLEEEQAKRRTLTDEKNRLEHRMLAIIHELKAAAHADECTRAELQARAEGLQRDLHDARSECIERAGHADVAVTALSEAMARHDELKEASAKAATACESRIRELQEQVLLLTQGEAARSSEQQMRLAALVSSFNSLRRTCEGQATEISELASAKRRLEDDKRKLKERLTETTALMASVQAEKDRVLDALNTHAAQLHSAQMELTLTQHRGREAQEAGNMRGGFQNQLDLSGADDYDAYGPSSSRTHPTSAHAAPYSSSGYYGAPQPPPAVLRAQLALSKLRGSLGALHSPGASPVRAQGGGAGGWGAPVASSSRPGTAGSAVGVLASRNNQLARENVLLRTQLAMSPVPSPRA